MCLLIFLLTFLKSGLVYAIFCLFFILESKYTLLPNGDLLIKSVQTNEVKGNYRCKLRHRLTGEIAVSSSAGKIIVTESHRSTPARITESLTSIRAYEGENIFLPCLSQGYPIPQMSWQQRQLEFQPSSMVSSDLRVKEFSNAGLLIEKASSHHNGQYTCFVNNSVGTDTIDTEVKIYGTTLISSFYRYLIFLLLFDLTIYC
jgi:AGAP010884-PA (fragment)